MATINTAGNVTDWAKPLPVTGQVKPPRSLTTATATTTAVPTSTTAQPVTLPTFNLPSLDGSQFVAQPGQGNTAQAPSVSDVISQIGQNFQFQPGQNPTEIIQQIQAAFAQQARPGATDVTMNSLDQILNREGSYIANARRRGLEQAGSRGMLNSSMAAGAAQRAATEAAMPILSEAMNLNNQRESQDFQREINAINATVGLTEQERAAAIQEARDRFAASAELTGQREQNAFTGQQQALDRVQGVNNALLAGQLREREALLGSQLGREEAVLDAELRGRLQSDAAAQQDWLASNAFSREFNGVLSMMPINSAFQLNNMIAQYAAENPEVYTPDIISGMTNFFNRNMLSMLQQYFPNMVGGR